jgi:hypothetical protein
VVRLALFAFAFVVASAAVYEAADRALDEADLPRTLTALDFIPKLHEWQDGMASDREHQRIALVGDSKLIYPLGKNALDAMLRGVLAHRRGGSRMALHTLAWPAWNISGQYLMTDEIVRAKPDAVVLELNLHGFGPAPLGQFAFPQLSGWVSTRRVAQAAFMPLSYANITLDKLLFYKLLTVLGLDERWRDLLQRQAKLFRLREPIETFLDGVTGRYAHAALTWELSQGAMRRAFDRGRNRATPRYVDSVLGDTLEGLAPTYPRVRALDALLETLAAAHVPTLVWVAPVNVDHLASLGYATTGLDRSVNVLRSVALRRGAAFLDLHSSLHDAEFRDVGDHFTFEGNGNGVWKVANRLAPMVLHTFRQDEQR